MHKKIYWQRIKDVVMILMAYSTSVYPPGYSYHLTLNNFVIYFLNNV